MGTWQLYIGNTTTCGYGKIIFHEFSVNFDDFGDKQFSTLKNIIFEIFKKIKKIPLYYELK